MSRRDINLNRNFIINAHSVTHCIPHDYPGTDGIRIAHPLGRGAENDERQQRYRQQMRLPE